MKKNSGESPRGSSDPQSVTRNLNSPSPMSDEQLQSLLAKAQNDPALKERLSSARSHEEIASIAAEQGHSISKPYLIRKEAEAVSRLSDEDLEKVAGGCFLSWHPLHSQTVCLECAKVATETVCED